MTHFDTSFTFTETPISQGGIWIHNGLDWALVNTTTTVQHGLAYGTQTGSGGFDDSYAYLGTMGWAPDQSASGVVYVDPAIDQLVTHEVEIHLRWLDAPHLARGYEFNYAWNGQYCGFVRWNGPFADFTPLNAGTPNGALQIGDVIFCKIVGNVMTAYRNGVQIDQQTDNTWTTGSPGMGYWRGGVSGPQTDVGFTRYVANDMAELSLAKLSCIVL